MTNPLKQLQDKVNYPSIPSELSPAPIQPRGLPSAETSYDIAATDPSGVVNNPLKPGLTRALWLTPINTVKSAVVSIKSSANPTSASEQSAYKAGLHANPTTTLTTMSVVPDMAVQLQCNSQIIVDFTGSFIGPSSATCTFALYRDNTQLLQRAYPMSPPVTGQPFMVNLNAADQPSPGVHSYSAQWAINSGTLTAAAYAREISALNHRPA